MEHADLTRYINKSSQADHVNSKSSLFISTCTTCFLDLKKKVVSYSFIRRCKVSQKVAQDRKRLLKARWTDGSLNGAQSCGQK